MKKFSFTELIISIVFAELVGAVSALLAGDFRGLYTEFIQPPLAPPAWVFPVVWVILYALMGITSYMIYRSDSYRSKSALFVYFVQLAVNFSWSIIFFRFELLTLAAVVAVVLTILVGIMICMFLSIRKKAGYFNVPYLLWMIFASYLAIGTMLLN
ncbi:MAG: tryptophan-rich sensory protein [Ruminococcus sp.]|nr:tryptophan-rich sensory protein [Ruminococcus sp.]